MPSVRPEEMKIRNTAPLVICFSALPTVALANAGTPLMLAGMLHLVFGNLFIGMLEGYLLAKFFGLLKGKTIGILILANYFSAWVGGLFLRGAIVRALPLDLNNAWFFFWAMVVLTYLITLLLEFPFVAVAFRRDPRWLSKSIRGSLIIQTISYTLLFGWYWLASGTSLYTKTDVVKLSAISLPEEVFMYFISANDGNVYAMHLAASDKHKVFDLKSTDSNDRLFVRVSSTNSTRWDLVARLVAEDRRNPKLVTVKEGFASETAPSWRSMHTDPPQEEDSWFNFGQVTKLGSAKNSQWEFWTGFWPVEGLHGTQTNTGAQVGFSFETPFGAWNVRNATLLPSDKVLFQLGGDQICVFDPLNKRVALVTKGRGPIAIIQDDRSNQVREDTARKLADPQH
jgi:hypothetical protein